MTLAPVRARSLVLAFVPALVLAVAFESPRRFTASELITPAQLKGPHHQVASEVPTEGYFHVFSFTSDWGPFEANGKSLLGVRLDEVRALAALDDVSKSEVFLASAGGAVLNVGKGVAAVAKDPEGTVKGMGGGIKRFGTNLGRKTKRAADQATSKDEKAAGSEESTTQKTADAAGGVANSVLGVSGAARKWAQKVGADPYTTNAVLKKALADIGKIDAAGSIAAKVVVPIPPVASTTASVGGLVWGKDPEALLKQNEAQLTSLGVSNAVQKQLYRSKGFTMTLHTRLVSALSAVKVKGSADYVAAAAESDTEREAAFFVESAEMLQQFHAQSPVVQLLSDSRALVAKTGDGRAVALVPVDWVEWTAAFEKALNEVTERARKELAASKLELRLTGRVSAEAKKQAVARGWSVVENAPAAARAK